MTRIIGERVAKASVRRRTWARFRSTTAAALVLAAGVADRAVAYQQEVRGTATQLAERMATAGKRSIAVADFTDLQGTVTELGRFLAEQVSVALQNESKGFEVIDRTHLKALLQEHKLSTTGIMDAQTARKLGQIAGADCLVTGSITPFGDSVNLSVKLLDTNTARMIGATTADLPRTKAVEELLARGIGDAAGSSPGRGAPAAPTAQSKDAVTASIGGAVITIRDCRKTGQLATCKGVVRNTTEGTLHIVFDRGGSEFFDNQGNQSRGCQAAFGTGSERAALEPDLPANFVLSEIGVAADATSFAARLSLYLSASGDSWRRDRSGTWVLDRPQQLTIRNIPLR